MTTQSPHVYIPQPRSAAARAPRTPGAPGSAPAAGPLRSAPAARVPRTAPAAGAPDTSPLAGAAVQTRLPWWAVALPAVAFAALLALLTGGTADASAAAPAGAWLGRLVMALPDLVRHLL